ncbi:hypothetical protein V6N13_071358 [Hibiscus sabdariffa]
MYDIVDELGYSGRYVLYWRHSGKIFSVKNLRTDSDVIAMVQDMTKNRHIHVYLEDVIANVIATEEAKNSDDSGSKEDPDYVGNDDNSESENSGSEFEDSVNDDSEREGYTHDVPGCIGFEMDLNNNLGGCYVRLNDEDVSEREELHSASDSDSNDLKKMRVTEFNNNVDMKNPQLKKRNDICWEGYS